MPEDKIEIVQKDFIRGDTAVTGETFMRNIDDVKQCIERGELVPLGRIEYLMDAITEPNSDLTEDQVNARRAQLRDLIAYAFEKNLIPEEEKKAYEGYLQELSA